MKILGVSSGMGVSLYPFRDDDILGNIENRTIFHTPKNIAWELNFPNKPLWREIPKIGLKPDVILSSPDCGSGSILRLSRSKELGDHKKNASLALFFEGVKEFKPKFFGFENLEALFKSFPKEDFEKMVPNYRLIIHSASVCMWGNSQIHRKRLVIIGIRKDISPKVDRFFKLPDYRERNKTCEELYGDLDEIRRMDICIRSGHVREDFFDVVTVYSKFKCTVAECKQYWDTRGLRKKRWEVDGRNFTTAPGVYRNRKNDYPATARKANRQFDHNGLMLTPRQIARIQGVPDDFKIHIEPDKLNYWINKGRALLTKTPPMEISSWFRKKLIKTRDIWW